MIVNFARLAYNYRLASLTSTFTLQLLPAKMDVRTRESRRRDGFRLDAWSSMMHSSIPLHVARQGPRLALSTYSCAVLTALLYSLHVG